MSARLRRTACALLAVNAALAALGCSYLKWRKDRDTGLRELKKSPSLALERDVLPEDCFMLQGQIEYGSLPRRQLLVAHVGILSDREALQELSRVLDAACVPGKAP